MKQSKEDKLALLRKLDKEMSQYVGRFLSQAEQLRVKSLGDEIERLEYELDKVY